MKEEEEIKCGYFYVEILEANDIVVYFIVRVLEEIQCGSFDVVLLEAIGTAVYLYWHGIR